MASIDVAVPCYQYGRFLRECVTSVLNQGISDIRVLIIDNASTDNSLEVARQLAAEDSRVQVVAHPTNLGLHASFNEGIDWASADYFVLLCADDLLAPGCLARAVAFMEQHPDVNLTFGRELTFGPGDPIPAADITRQPHWRILPGRELLERLCRTGRPDADIFIIGNTTVVVRTVAQKQAGHHRPELPHSSDLELWLRFACRGAAAQTDVVQGFRRLHTASRSASSIRSVHMWNLVYEAAFESFFANDGAQLPEAKRLRRMARHALGERAYWGCLANLLRGHLALSFDLLKFAISRCPLTIVVPPVGYLFRRQDTLRHFIRLVQESARRMAFRLAKTESAGD
jgi:glycosyltransferase involved in cell wall biosynthesis